MSETTSVRATAGRPQPGAVLAPGELLVSTTTASELGVGAGDGLVLRGPAVDRPVVAVVRGVDVHAPRDVVRLGSMLWTELGVRPLDVFRLELLPATEPLERVELVPAFHLFKRLGDRVVEQLRSSCAPLAMGGTTFVETFGGGGGVVLRVDDSDRPVGRVGETTKVSFGRPDPAVGMRRQTLADVGGMGHEIARIKELVMLPLTAPGVYRGLGIKPTRGVLVSGPPGVGKTLLCRAVGAQLGADVFEFSAADLVGTFSGETEANIRKAFGDASHHAPALLVIDELDALAVRRDAAASQGDARVATQLLSLMDGLEQIDGVVVIATTNRPDAIDDAFRRPGRFDVELQVGMPDETDRKQILQVHTREMPLTPGAESEIARLARSTAGYTGADLMQLAREVGLAAGRRLGRERGAKDWTELSDLEFAVLAQDVEDGARRVGPSVLRAIERRAGADVPAWSEIEGLEQAQASLVRIADATLRDGAPDGGVLLSGPPGSGKSMLVNSLAGHVGVPVVQIDGASIFDQWLGQSESAVRQLFRRASQVAPSIVAVDHLDALAPTRNAERDGAYLRVLAALMAEIDAVAVSPVLVIGMTDRVDLVDPSIIRPGRLGHRIELSRGMPHLQS